MRVIKLYFRNKIYGN